MRDFLTFRRAAIRYWELRRIFYNLALVPPTLLGYLFGSGHNTGMSLDTFSALLLFSLYVIGANVCYTFAYAIEFLIGGDDQRLWWMRFGRLIALVAGVVLGMLLALGGAYDFARAVHSYK
jgi:hypothetical protein